LLLPYYYVIKFIDLLSGRTTIGPARYLLCSIELGSRKFAEDCT